ncbi:MAG: ATP-binding protein [Thermodesulfobacteriota bacterium]
MLLKFGAENFFCFKEGIEISLELGPQCPQDISRGNAISNLLCIKGANGSGKTNALKIIAFMKDFCCDSFNKKPDNEIVVDSFFNNDNPICLYCDFIIYDITYRYELCLKKEGVLSEKLFRKIKRETLLFHREDNNVAYCTKEFSRLKSFKQRSNASIISTANQYEVLAIAPVYSFFDSIITNVSWQGRVDFANNHKYMSKYYYNNPDVLKKAIKIIKNCDLGISDINVYAQKDEEGEENYFPIFSHDADVEKNILTFFSQSLGTQTLFKIIPYYIYAIKTGGLLVMDEFDIDLHPHMLPIMVKQFDDEEINPKNAQMLFSTHSADILEYMGKYRTVIINKDKSESYGYRLDEIQGDIVRNDRLLAPVYNSGKIGGVPRI